MAQLTLLEKLRGVMTGDDATAGLLDPCWSYPGKGVNSRDLTDLEDRLRTWGCFYGVAFGLARSEEPCESAESVGRRAYEAARVVFEDFIGGRLYGPKENAEGEEVVSE